MMYVIAYVCVNLFIFFPFSLFYSFLVDLAILHIWTFDLNGCVYGDLILLYGCITSLFN